LAHSGIPTLLPDVLGGHRLTEPEALRIMNAQGQDVFRIHLHAFRYIQDETHGFTEFIPMAFIHANTPLYQLGIARAGSTGREDILMLAVSRPFLDNFKNIQVSWGKLGIKMTQVALLCGGNDLAGTMFTDDVSLDAGASDAGYLGPAVMEHIVSDIGRTLRQRTTLYELT